MANLTELNKLEEYLIWHNIPYERKDKPGKIKGGHLIGDWHQIVGLDEYGGQKWDALYCSAIYVYDKACYDAGLLEYYDAKLKEKDSDPIRGMTAEQVIKKIESDA